MSDVGHNVQMEPILQPLSWESFNLASACKVSGGTDISEPFLMSRSSTLMLTVINLRSTYATQAEVNNYLLRGGHPPRAILLRNTNHPLTKLWVRDIFHSLNPYRNTIFWEKMSYWSRFSCVTWSIWKVFMYAGHVSASSLHTLVTATSSTTLWCGCPHIS